MDTGHRIITGHVSVATLTASYEITGFPLQSDQDLTIPWACSSLIPARRKRVSLSGKASFDGGYISHLAFSLMTYGMYDYWLDSFMPSNAPSGDVTVMLYDHSNTAVFLQMTIYQPDQLNQIEIGYEDVIFPLRFGTIIT